MTLSPLTPALFKKEFDDYVAHRFDPDAARRVLQNVSRIKRCAGGKDSLSGQSRECLETIRTLIKTDLPNLSKETGDGFQRARDYFLFHQHLPDFVSKAFVAAINLVETVVRRIGLIQYGLIRWWKASPVPAYPSCKELNSSLTAEQRETRLRSPEHVKESLEKQFGYAKAQMDGETDSDRYGLISDRTESLIPAAHEGAVRGLSYGVCHFIGRRRSMEDESLETTIELAQGLSVPTFAIFDGHSGDGTARFLKERMSETVQRKLGEFNLTESGIWNALKMAFVELSRASSDGSGSTATAAFLIGDELWVANVGDSRTFLNANGQAIALTEDAKPGSLEEPTHFTAKNLHRGGMPVHNRVNGNLAVAAAIGDHDCQGMTARATITRIKLSELPANTDLILTCDGVFESEIASTKQVVAQANLLREQSCGEVARQIVGAAYEAGSGDNLSALVIRLK